jgi:O-antigen/teichoic acid export membrane protein
MSLKRDISKVFSANLIVMIVSVFISFLLPKWLSIDEYAMFRTYTLFVSFIGILHLGFIDGLNVKFGGVEVSRMSTVYITNAHRFFVLFQATVSMVILLAGLLLGNTILTFFGLAVIPMNLHSYSMLIYQASGKFTPYSLGLTLSPILSLILYFTLHTLGILDYKPYALAHMGGYLLVVVFLEIYFFRVFGMLRLPFPKVILREVKELFSIGVYILFGNTLFILFNTLGRWGIKVFMDNSAFAFYSFATSMLGFIILAINSIALTLYPHLSRKESHQGTGHYRSNFFMLGSFSLLFFYLVSFVVRIFLPDYTASIKILMILLASMPGLLIIKALYLNMYKVTQRTRAFWLDTIKYLLVALLLHAVIFFLFRSDTSMAIASVISIYVWVFSPPAFLQTERKQILKEVLYTVVCLTAYIFTALYLDSLLLSMAILILFLAVVNVVFYRKEFVALLKRIVTW